MVYNYRCKVKKGEILIKVLEVQQKVSSLVEIVKDQLSNKSRRVNRGVQVKLDIFDIDETGFSFEASTFKKDVAGTHKLEGNYNYDNECILFKLAINLEIDGEVKTIHYDVFKNYEKTSFRPDAFENDIEDVRAPEIKL